MITHKKYPILIQYRENEEVYTAKALSRIERKKDILEWHVSLKVKYMSFGETRDKALNNVRKKINELE